MLTDKIRWQCQCGVFGWMQAMDTSLAGLVRQARMEHADFHPCGDPDIEHLDTEEEFKRRCQPRSL